MSHAKWGCGPGQRRLVMLYRMLGLVCVAMALVVLASGSAVSAGDKGSTHEGKLVSAKDHKITMETKGKEHSHEVPATAKITCDGKECKLSDLKPGVTIRVTVDNNNRATRIEASTKSSKTKQ